MCRRRHTHVCEHTHTHSPRTAGILKGPINPPCRTLPPPEHNGSEKQHSAVETEKHHRVCGADIKQKYVFLQAGVCLRNLCCACLRNPFIYPRNSGQGLSGGSRGARGGEACTREVGNVGPILWGHRDRQPWSPSHGTRPSSLPPRSGT